MSDSSRPHGLQPTRLLHPWDFPGKSTGVGCHCLLRSWLKLMSIELVMSSHHLNLCHPLLLLPSIFSSIGIFSSESSLCIRWPKYWNFNFSISPSNEYSGLISFRIDWLDLLAVQGLISVFSITTFKWHPTPVLLPGKSHGWRSLVGCSP